MLFRSRTAAAVTPLTMRTAAGVSEGSMQPAVAWRSASHPTAGMVMAHQTASTLPFAGPPNVYYGATTDSACTNATILSAVTIFPDGAAPPVTYTLAGAVLPVDVALDPMGTSFLVAAPGNANGMQVLRYAVPTRPPTPSPTVPRTCLTATRLEIGRAHV